MISFFGEGEGESEGISKAKSSCAKRANERASELCETENFRIEAFFHHSVGIIPISQVRLFSIPVNFIDGRGIFKNGFLFLN